MGQYPQLRFSLTDYPRKPQETIDLNNHLKELKSRWEEVEEKVMSTFEDVAHGKWGNEWIRDGVDVVLTGNDNVIPNLNEENKVITLRFRDFTLWARDHNREGQSYLFNHQFAKLIHELTHAFECGSDDREYVKKHFSSLILMENIKLTRMSPERAFYQTYIHIHTELLWKEVIKRCFTDEFIQDVTEVARNISPIYTEAYRIIDTLSREEKKKVVDRSLR